MKGLNGILFAGIYFDVMEIQPLVQGIFRFDSTDQKVNINYSVLINMIDLNRWIYHVLKLLPGVIWTG